MNMMNKMLMTVAIGVFGLIASADSVITPFDGGYRVDYTENESEYSAFVYTNTTKTYTFPVPAGCTAVDALVVGGGGAGGHRGTGNGTGGGGGAGGFLEIGDLSAFSAGATMSVKVGAGGIGGSVKDRRAATSGEDSSLTAGGTTYTAHGGGCGGVDSTSLPASSQGSGGGGGVWSKTVIGRHLTGTDEYGNDGGKGGGDVYVGGGGGGAGAKGADAGTTRPRRFGGVGGEGKVSFITGAEVWYAGGGGGGSMEGSDNYKTVQMSDGGKGGGGKGGPDNYWNAMVVVPPVPLSVMNGTDGLGGGGGGAGTTDGDSDFPSGNGGSGTVIIRVVKSGAATKVAIPTAVQDLVYTGGPQVGVTATTGCTVTGGEKTDVGDYTATASLDDPEGTTWTDETTDDKQIAWSIARAENVWTVEPSISPSVVYVGEPLPVLTVGTAQFGGTPTVTYDGGQTEMPETLGSHTVTVSVAGTGNWTALTKELSYSIQEPPQEWGYSVHYTSDDIEYAAFVYTNTTKTYTFSVPNGYTAVDALVVGGGGAGGGAAEWNAVGGGGGAGGFLEVGGLSAFSAGARMTVKVGAGGIGSSKSEERNPTSGENSLLTAGGTTYTAHGGGRGGCSKDPEMPASSGGSGGGGGVWNSSKDFGVHDIGQASTGECGSKGGGGYSENGATPGAGGGGGGATGVGTQAERYNGGAGGAGKMSAITGEPVWYAGGGGGGYAGSGTRGAGGDGGGGAGGAGNFSEMCGVDGTGGGGGGAGGSEGAESGNGGNGTVIIRVRKTGAMPPGLMIIINSPAA